MWTSFWVNLRRRNSFISYVRHIILNMVSTMFENSLDLRIQRSDTVRLKLSLLFGLHMFFHRERQISERTFWSSTLLSWSLSNLWCLARWTHCVNIPWSSRNFWRLFEKWNLDEVLLDWFEWQLMAKFIPEYSFGFFKVGKRFADSF